ncbi:MAG: hypothetical protein WC877_00450 [Dehalococcoidales bacterium]|jgi:hypothetical protein
MFQDIIFEIQMYLSAYEKRLTYNQNSERERKRKHKIETHLEMIKDELIKGNNILEKEK